MKLNYEVTELERISTRNRGIYEKLLIEFIQGDGLIARIDDTTFTNAASCAAYLNKNAKRMGIPVHAFSANGKVYIEKERK